MTFIANDTIRCPSCGRGFLAVTGAMSIQENDMDMLDSIMSAWSRCPFCSELFSRDELAEHKDEGLPAEEESYAEDYELPVLDREDGSGLSPLWPGEEDQVEAAKILSRSLITAIASGSMHVRFARFLDCSEKGLVFPFDADGNRQPPTEYPSDEVGRVVSLIEYLAGLRDKAIDDNRVSLFDFQYKEQLYRAWVKFRGGCEPYGNCEDIILDAEVIIQNRGDGKSPFS